MIAAGLVVGAQAALNIGIGDHMTLTGTVIGGTPTGTVTYKNNSNQDISENCYAGIFGLNANDTSSHTSGTIYTFCTDVGVNWTSGSAYTAVQFAGQTGVNPTWANTPASIQNASFLYNNYFIPNAAAFEADGNLGAGMQLAIWKLLYDTKADGTVGTLDNINGSFRATGFGSGVAQANILLNYVNTARGNGTFVQYIDTWLKPDLGNSQGMIYNALTPVPEPTTMIAGALLLVPFGASTLRTFRRNRAS